MSYFLKLPVDTNYEEKLERKRQVLLERGRRIFDPTLSKQAYDVAEIATQVNDRKVQETAERVRNSQFDHAALRLDRVHHYLQAKENGIKRTIAQKIDLYRQYYQRPEDAASFELNNPNALKIQRPIGQNGDYSKYGPSSILTFESDLLRTPEEIKNNVNRQRSFLAEQMVETQVKKDQDRHRDNVAHKESMAQQAKLYEMELATHELQKASALATSQYNDALATHQQSLRKCQTKLDDTDCRTHVKNALNSDFLNERGSDARNPRGISEEEQQRLFEAWKVQVHEKNATKDKKRHEENTWDNYFRSVQNDVDGKMMALKDERASLRRRIDDWNKQQAANNNTEREKIERLVDNSRFTEEFSSRFGNNPR